VTLPTTSLTVPPVWKRYGTHIQIVVHYCKSPAATKRSSRQTQNLNYGMKLSDVVESSENRA